MSNQPLRHFPVRPDLDQLRHQAKDLHRAVLRGDREAIDLFLQLHPRLDRRLEPKLTAAQLVLARSYGLPSWSRLVKACRMTEAIWTNDIAAVRELVLNDPNLLFEDARGVQGNWGPPMSYAANLGKDEIVAMLRNLGAQDVQFAFERACLQGRIDTARRLFEMGGRPVAGSVMGPCETLNPDGLAFQLELGAPLTDQDGDPLAPVGLILQTYCRNPIGKHRCLEIVATAGIALPNTPTMAVHRGRLDLLEAHLARDPSLFTRTFSHREIYPLALGCSEDETFALHGTPLAGGTLLHLCVDYDEFDVAEWALAKGAQADTPAAIDEDGFGGHTALFGTIVSQPYVAQRPGHERFARLLLDHGADPTVRASLRKALRFVEDETLHEYRNVTPHEWGEWFHNQDWVNPAAMRLVAMGRV